MTPAEALAVIRRSGTVEAVGCALKIRVPKNQLAGLKPALEVLRNAKTEVLSVLANISREAQPQPPTKPERFDQEPAHAAGVGLDGPEVLAALHTFGSWPEWKAWALNELFRQQGCAGEPGRITAATVAHSERDRPQDDDVKVQGMPPDPKHPGKHINPATGIWPTSEWGPACRRGFVSNERFGSGPVVPRTNRGNTRKWLKLRASSAKKPAGEPQ
jgi:hypothetical protein